jgi:transcriptional regulator with XRE-family HTH domain
VTTQGEAGWLLKETEVNAALGATVRLAREAAGLTRPELAERLPFKVSVQTLLKWELGYRAISYGRLVEVGRTLGCTSPDLLRQAIARIESIQTQLVTIDLQALRTDQRYEALRTWAEHKFAATRKTAVTVHHFVTVHHSVVREWAVLLNVNLVDLVAHLQVTASMTEVNTG